MTIGSSNYTLIFDDRGPAASRGIAIAINNAGTPRSEQALISTNAVPEPATTVQFGTGLLALSGSPDAGR
jgi:hypothetical protein